MRAGIPICSCVPVNTHARARHSNDSPVTVDHVVLQEVTDCQEEVEEEEEEEEEEAKIRQKMTDERLLDEMR